MSGPAPDLYRTLADPLKLGRAMWPHVRFYDKEIEIVRSVQQNIETYVIAGNQLGKDFIAGYIALTFFIVPQIYFPASYVKQIEAQRRPGFDPHTRRILTTSVKDEHIDVLWGEIGRFYTSCKVNLKNDFVLNSHELRLRKEVRETNPLSYLKGMVAANSSGMVAMAGHHAAYTLMIGDEASGLSNEVHDKAQGWAKKFLYFGNPNDCNNFWRKGCDAGDLLAEVA